MKADCVQKQKKRRRELLCLAGIAACSLACYCGTGIYSHHSSPSARGAIQENIQTLSALEQRSLPEFHSQAPEPQPTGPADTQPAEKPEDSETASPEFDQEAEKEKILGLTDWDGSKLSRWFQPAAVVGDSIAQGIVEYDWLDESQVFSKIGVSLSTGGGLVEQAIRKDPSVIILCFGLNDLETYEEQVDRFLEHYTACIQRVQAALPNAAIYVHGLFAPDASVTKGFYQYLDTYNSQLEALCGQLEVHFIDSSFILEAKPELYDADGIHPISAFYPLWLTYLADVTGLSNENK